MKLTIRKNGNYYQLGYWCNEKRRWINLEQLGTAERVLQLVCRAKNKEVPAY